MYRQSSLADHPSDWLAEHRLRPLRMLRRNHVTDEYKDIVNHLRRELTKRSSTLGDYELPFRPTTFRLFRGGLAETVAVMNAIVLIVGALLWLPAQWVLLASPFILLAAILLHPIVKWSMAATREPESPTFRTGVGALIMSDSGQVLSFERADLPGSWQLPQGGLHIGETPLEAVWREVHEETGITAEHLTPLQDNTILLAYELPAQHRSAKTGRGQVLHWFLFRFSGSDSLVTVGGKNAEFQNWKWTTLEELVSSVVHFKRHMYEQLARELKEVIRKSN